MGFRLPVPNLWFHEAYYVRGSERTHFERSDEHPFERFETAEGGALLRFAVDRLHPFFDPLDLTQVFSSNCSGMAVTGLEQRLTTGAPGRPGSKHLVDEEFKRRAATGEAEETLSSEASYLSKWLTRAYPQYPPMTVKSVENAIRPAFNRQRRQSPSN
jgi:hypothetical protein